jgi:hypothetical protein
MSLWSKFKNFYPFIKIEWQLHQSDFPPAVRRVINDAIVAIDAELAQESKTS